ncbi:hypothetical protein CY34DRAFT_105698 [Suillus luteus UH-Slu-Lm8-n1]|uniref:Uncharacterized protein n=1 Tax=Suillus luteus UH-Slu-Lm8-n1 TaxID=930992 RepID=A0A0D0BFU4_9AGAM|nr:hypothetical protein CY34DRAFT_105698 [Suillus luteus UH-Slu-Lm8-n1]
MPQFPPVPSHVPYHPDPHAHLYNPFAHADHPAYGAPVHPPQYWGGYPPTSQGVGVPPAPAQLSERTIKHGKRKAADSDDAPPSKKQAIQLRGDNNHTQGVGQQALAPPFYPATFPLVQTYHPHTQQELWQQTPAEESAVKRGKRKAVELDDAPPRQAIQHRVDDFVKYHPNQW